MGKKLTGILKCNRIPRELVRTNDKGEKTLWVDVIAKKEADQYGNTHTITCYDKESGKTFYLADLKTVEFGKKEETPKEAPKEAPSETNDDLPF